MEYVQNSIPSQLRHLRQEREWTQDDLGKATDKPRNVITRLENPNSNVPNIATMYEMALGFQAGLLVKIVPFSELLREFEKPHTAFSALPITHKDEESALQDWINSENPEYENSTDTLQETVQDAEPYLTATGVPLNIIRPQKGGQSQLHFDTTRPTLVSSNPLSEIEQELSEELSITSEGVGISEPELTNTLYRTQKAS
ncbi:MAG: helix-turn-helix domain-containing protein [Pyrinomonadaceae bacterium]